MGCDPLFSWRVFPSFGAGCIGGLLVSHNSVSGGYTCCREVPLSLLRANVVSPNDLNDADRARMYLLLGETYDHTHMDRFVDDINRKDDVIVLRDAEGLIQGFSTLRNLEVRVDGALRRVVYSGDTVIAKAHWGQRVLGRAFLKYLFTQKLRHPFEPLYWMLITKGFKTYLLMANNFSEHHPRFDGETSPAMQSLMDASATMMFGEHYSPTTGLVRFSEPMGQLKPGIADVTADLVSRYPRVRYFQERNPDWRDGDELVCFARMTWFMPLYYSVKALRKLGLRAVS